jgi:hypothetical protein
MDQLRLKQYLYFRSVYQLRRLNFRSVHRLRYLYFRFRIFTWTYVSYYTAEKVTYVYTQLNIAN